jgi:hypothetical protein
MVKNDEISEYYAKKRERLAEAQRELEKAIANKAPYYVIEKLRDRRDRIGHVGD